MTGPPRGGERKEDEMTVVMVRQKVKDGSVETAAAAARDLFATLDRVRPEGLQWIRGLPTAHPIELRART